MKDNKGFTLIELIAIITIIAVILLIGFININKIADNRKDDLYNKLVGIIESAGKDYMDKHVADAESLIEEAVNSNRCVLVSTLITESLLDSNLKDPRDNSSINTSTYVKITNTATGFDYEYFNSTDTSSCVGGILN